ncbi:MAG TPA: DUF6090 family protein [Rudaea sp.]|nr:DUF6090 family protein [Rudaea sp.]
MITKRVIEHMKQQQWTAVVIEIAIVVLGVFIGIQVSNWNEDRENDRKAAVFTERLKADLREEDWRYQLMITYNRQVLENAERAVDALDGTAPLPEEALLVSAYRATQYKQGLRRRTTYDELISTGAIGLIRDQSLRDTAMRNYNSATIDSLINDGIHSRYREAFRMALPTQVQRALAKNCGDRLISPGDYAGLPDLLDYPCRTGLPDKTIRDSAATLRGNPALVPALRLRIADLETRLADLSVNNGPIVQGLRAIAKEKP